LLSRLSPKTDSKLADGLNEAVIAIVALRTVGLDSWPLRVIASAHDRHVDASVPAERAASLRETWIFLGDFPKGRRTLFAQRLSARRRPNGQARARGAKERQRVRARSSRVRHEWIFAGRPLCGLRHR
jgi:hypothetical protein